MKRLLYQRILFPAPAAKVKTMSCGGKNDSAGTDASHVTTRGNLGQNVSTLRKFGHESTMLRIRCVEIRVRCYDSSKDLEERSTFECFPAILHLRNNRLKLSAFMASSGVIEEQLTPGLVDIARNFLQQFY